VATAAEDRLNFRRATCVGPPSGEDETCFAKSNPIVVTSPMDGSHSLLFRSDSSLALRCCKGAIHPIIRAPSSARASSVGGTSKLESHDIELAGISQRHSIRLWPPWSIYTHVCGGGRSVPDRLPLTSLPTPPTLRLILGPMRQCPSCGLSTLHLPAELNQGYSVSARSISRKSPWRRRWTPKISAAFWAFTA